MATWVQKRNKSGRWEKVGCDACGTQCREMVLIGSYSDAAAAAAAVKQSLRAQSVLCVCRVYTLVHYRITVMERIYGIWID